MQMSASEMLPESGSKKTRVRPVISALENIALFSRVSAIVIKLIPSPLPELIDWAVEVDSMKFMFATRDHREIARRAAPTTSLPNLKFGPGVVRDVESAMVILRFGHFTCRLNGRDTENAKLSRL